jgi:hypothetical protein
MSKKSFFFMLIIFVLALAIASVIVFNAVERFQADAVSKDKEVEKLLDVGN